MTFLKKYFKKNITRRGKDRGDVEVSPGGTVTGEPNTVFTVNNDRTCDQTESSEDNAFVFDQRTGAGFEHIPEKDIPEASILREYCGKDVHFLWRDKDNRLFIRDMAMKAEDGASPNDLYDALEDKDSPRLFCTKEKSWLGSASKALFIVIGFMLFFLFIIWGANLGKEPVDAGESPAPVTAEKENAR